MDCPRDKREMEHQAYWKHPRQACPACQGIFVPESDVTEKLGVRGKKFAAVAEVKLENVRDGKLACPKDGTTMKALRFGDAEIDVCASCHGLWLDRGEYEKIIARMRERGDAMRRNPKLAVHQAAEAQATASSLVSVDGVLDLLGGALSAARFWSRVLNSGTAASEPPRKVETAIPAPRLNPNCRR